jgi:hypothetical protein
MQERISLGQLLGNDLESEFKDFDMSEIQEVLATLRETDTPDIAHSEMLQQKSLRGADIISEYLGQIIKVVSYLETKLNSTKNRVALGYKNGDGSRTTADAKKAAAESDPEVEELGIKLAYAKGSKVLLEKKYDLLIKTHHHYKDLANNIRKSIVGYSGQGQEVNNSNSGKVEW